MAKVQIKGLASNKASIQKAVNIAVDKAMRDVLADLERTASEAAPLDEGDLEMSGSTTQKRTGTKVKGTVKFEAWNDNPNRSYDFNYAIWTHEEVYNLGPKSAAKPNATGMSGRSYPVGRKYLTGVLDGEKQTYRNYVEELVKDALK